jgi:hypothetical protein
MTVTATQLGFPFAAQLARVEREIEECKSGKISRETVYVVTSLTAEKADAGRLLALVRGHWRIENSGHWRLDASAGEDGCRVRHAGAAWVLGEMRRVVLGEYLEWAGRQKSVRDRTLPCYQDRVRDNRWAAVHLVTSAKGGRL